MHKLVSNMISRHLVSPSASVDPQRTYPAAYLVRLPRSSRSLYIASYSFFRLLYKHSTGSKDRKWHFTNRILKVKTGSDILKKPTGSQDRKWHSTHIVPGVKTGCDILHTQNQKSRPEVTFYIHRTRSQARKWHSTCTELEVKPGSDILHTQNWKSRLDVTFYIHRTRSQDRK